MLDSRKNTLLLLLFLAASGCPDRAKNEDPRQEQRLSHKKQHQRKLGSLPYLNWVPVNETDRARKGVTRFDTERAHPGLNLYNSRPRSEAKLVDMKGRVLHSWSNPVDQPGPKERRWAEIWPNLDFAGWHHVELLPSGHLLAVVGYHRLIKLDWDSRLIWTAPISAHHDVAVMPSGEIYALTGQKLKVRLGEQTLTLLDTHLVLLSSEGKVLRRLSLFQTLRRDPRTARLVEEKLKRVAPHFATGLSHYIARARLLQSKENVEKTAKVLRGILSDTPQTSSWAEYLFMHSLEPMDFIHANSIEILPREVPGLGRRGDLLLSLREMNLVLVLDPRTKRVRWSWGPGVVERQHQPSLLNNGNLLIFDNAPSAKRSRVIELDPRTGRIVWSFVGKPPKSFFSMVRGGCQPLPGGSVLITDSERGRVFEVTRQGEVVWEYFNPDLDDPYMTRKRAPIYRMVRLEPGWLEGHLLRQPKP